MAIQKKVPQRKLASDNSRNKMYYDHPADRSLIREGDVESEDAADPMETDGYGPDQGVGGFQGEPNFSVSPPKAAPGGLTIKLRKRGMPKA